MGDVDPSAETQVGLAGDLTAAEAWSLDDSPDYVEPVGWWSAGRVTAAAVSVAVLLTAGAGVVAWKHLRPEGGAPAAQPSTSAPESVRASVPPVAPPPPPPPSTVTVTAAPPPIYEQLTPDTLQAIDESFVRKLQMQGWQLKDPRVVVQRAHQLCAWIQRGATPEEATWRMVDDSGDTRRQYAFDQTWGFTQVVTGTYPNCG